MLRGDAPYERSTMCHFHYTFVVGGAVVVMPDIYTHAMSLVGLQPVWR
jgi:hypothetical protein